MSDEGEIDVESDDVAEGGDVEEEGGVKSLDKRAHHNALERKRRDHIKDSFTNLRDCIPSLSGEKVSRAHVLNKATEYIRQMQKNSSMRSIEIEELKKKNEILEEQVNGLEQAQDEGAAVDAENLIASIAEKVQQRQLLRQQQTQQTQQNNKSNKVQLEPAPIDGTKSGNTNEGQSNSYNLLANNIRTTQNLLSALAKNIPSSSTNSQMRAIAARVLASPVRAQNATSTPAAPRGVVTAMTVPTLTEQLPRNTSTTPITNTTQQTHDSVSLTVLTGTEANANPVVETNMVTEQAVVGEETTVLSGGGGEAREEHPTTDDGQPPTKRIKTSEC